MPCIEIELCNQKLTQRSLSFCIPSRNPLQLRNENLMTFPVHFIKLMVITTTTIIIIIQLLGTENYVQKFRRFCTFLEQAMGSQTSPKEAVFSPNSTKHQAETEMALSQYLYQKTNNSNNNKT